MDFNKIQTVIDDQLSIIIDEISEDFKLDGELLKNKYIQRQTIKRRGRKKKPKENFIETETYKFNDKTYLVDSNNNVYTYNVNNPVLIGEKLINGNIKFIDGYLESLINKEQNENEQIDKELDRLVD